MKKNLLFKGVAMLGTISLLTIVFMPGLDTCAAEEPAYVASIGDKKYTTLEEASNDVSDGGTITLIGDINEKASLYKTGASVNSYTRFVISSEKSNLKYSLDLNGHTITCTEAHCITVRNNNELTIKDSSNDGKIQSNYDQIIDLRDGGKLIIETGEISTTSDYVIAMFKNTSIVVKGGKLTASGPVISGNGSGCPSGGCTFGDTDMKIIGGEITSNNDYAIYHPASETLLISGDVVIQGNAGAVAMNYGKIVVNSGTLISNNVDNSGIVDSNGTAGHKASVIDLLSRYGDTIAEINGGRFVGNTLFWTGTDSESNGHKPQSVIVKGGTFSVNVPSEYLSSDADIIVTDAEAKIGNIQYKTLADAIDAANDDSNTIDLLNNISLSNTIEITKDLTINLNNYNIEATNARALWIKNGDVIITGSGTISANATELSSFEDSSSVIRVGDKSENNDKAFLSVGENVSVTSNHCYGITVFGKNDMELIMNGTVDVTGTSPAISGNGSAGLANTNITIGSNAKVKATQDTAIYYPGGGELNVKGGTIEGFNGIVARAGTIKIAADTVFNVFGDGNRKVGDANDPLVLKGKAIVMDIAASYPKSQDSDFIVENELGETFVIVGTKDSYNTYSVKYGENVENQTVKLTKDGTSAKIAKPADPTKNCNKFDGWFVGNDKYNFDAVVTGDLALVSKWTYTCSSSGGGSSGGSSSSSSSSKTITTDTKKAEETKTENKTSEEIELKGEVTEEQASEKVEETSTPDNGYSKEFNDAYTWAFKNGITTMSPIEKADMNAPLTRIAMAKMLSQYAINVLGRTPDTTKVVPAFPDVSAELDAAYNSGVTLAYQLGIMGINIDKFRPDDLVTRAEFGTALSRMLYATADGEKAYYETHLAKLMEEKIITVDTPDLQELRGYVMIMLMRSANK